MARLRFVLPKKEYDIVVVGNAPTATEVLEQKPFLATASALFKRTLAAVVSQMVEYGELSKEPSIFYTYASYEQIRSNDPSNDQIKAGKVQVNAVLAHAKPKVILTLGRAARTSVATTRAGEVYNRGGWRWDSKHNAYVLATLHPAYVLSDTKQFTFWTRDINKALELTEAPAGEDLVKPVTVTHTMFDKETALRFLKFLRSGDVPRHIACDIETRGFDFRGDALLCAGFTYTAGTSYVIPEELIDDADIVREMKITMESDNTRWIWQNGKFDAKFYWSQLSTKAVIHEDTMLMHYCLDVRKGTHGLEQLAIEYLDADPWEHEAHKYVKESFADIPRPILYKYQGVDTDMTFRLYELFTKLFDKERKRGRKIDKMYGLLMDAANNYMRMELNGMSTDAGQIAKLKEEYLPRLEQSLKDLERLASETGWNVDDFVTWADKMKLAEWHRIGSSKGKKIPGPTKAPKAFNPNSYMHVRFMLFSAWNLKPIKKKGKISSDADSLRIYQEKLTDPDAIRFIDAKLLYAKDKKMYSTYILGVSDLVYSDTGRVHTTMNLHGTETGRLSSSNPNFHNIPRQSDIKNMMNARKGAILIQGDYSQAELRVLAVEGGDPWLTKVYTDDKDLHDEISIQLFGEDFTKEQRVRAKAVNFGIPYGRTEYTLAAEHGISLSEARQMIDDWFEPQPLTYEWMSDRRQDPVLGRVFETPVGRIRPFGLVTSENIRGLQNEAVNFPIQSEASDCMVWSVCRIQEGLDELNKKYFPTYGHEVALAVNTVHDSIILEIEKDHTIVREVWQLMEKYLPNAAKQVLDTDVPFKVDYEIGYNWGDLVDADFSVDGKVFAVGKGGELIDILSESK